MTTPPDITRLLAASRGGERAALDEVFRLVYGEIRRIASGQLARAGRGDGTLSTTAVVHEAFLKLVRSPAIEWQDRGHFYAVAATAMRQILLNHARARATRKRDGGHRVPMEALAALAGDDARPADDLLALEDALTRLATLDERLAQVVELRFFAGLTVEECAAALGVTDRTIKRDWRAARAFLLSALADPEGA